MLPVMVLILLLHGCLAASDESPKFISKNFNNVLHWKRDQRNISGEQVLYSVEYWRHGDEDQQNKKSKLECQRITTLSCDLTAETPPIPHVHYIARVNANGVSHGQTYRFIPIAHTVLGPPIVSVTSTMSSLHVNVTLPSGPNGTPLADIFNNIKQPSSIEHGTYYKLYITDPKWAAQDNESTSGQFVINLKNKNTKYCGYVVYGPNFQMGRDPSEKAFFCGTLKGDPWVVYRWIVIAAVLLMVLIIISVVFTIHYVNGGKKQSMPKVLVTRLRIQDNIVLSPDVNLLICKPTVCPQICKPAVGPQSDSQTIYATIQTTVQVPSESSGGYSPQDFPCPAMSWDSSSSLGSSRAPTVSQDTSNQSSAIYGAVGVHASDEEAQEFQQPTPEYTKDMILCPSLLGKPHWSLVEPRKMVTSHEASPFRDLDSQDSISEGTLLLPTFRDSNGQLSFPMSNRGSRSAMTGKVIPLIPKWQPHVSDLIDTGEGCPVTLLSLNSIDESELSDSDYDQSISPSQVPYNSHDSPFKLSLPASSTEDQTSQMGHVTFESGYKQNWMPASPHGITAGDNSEHDRTDPSGDGDEDEGDQMFLGGWVIQIQGRNAFSSFGSSK